AKTGRPVDVAGSRYENGPVLIWPGTYGVHNWQPMSFSPKDGLTFIPTIHMANYYSAEGIDARSWLPTKNAWNTGLADSDLNLPLEEFSSALLAWDPVTQTARWRVPTAGTLGGGTMATAGGLVFQGELDGTFNARSTSDGRKLWSVNAGVAVTGAPISFSVGRRQYVTVLAGPPGGTVAYPEASKKFGWQYRDPRRVLTFVLDGRATLPSAPPSPLQIASSGGDPVDPALAAAGATLFGGQCASCHGTGAVSGGAGPDLRASAIVLSETAFAETVRDGALLKAGMPQFNDLSSLDIESVRSYLRSRAADASAEPGGAMHP
ncbi:MAG: c-type cytochrome, partial [Gammaproteobacteria bacterium]